MLQSWHQSGEQFEILWNKKKYDSLPADLKAILGYAVEAASADMSWKAIERYSQDYIELQSKDKVKFYKTPDSLLAEQLKAWDAIVAKKSAENPMFAKVIEAQKKFAERATKWQNDTNIDFKVAAKHYFSKKA